MARNWRFGMDNKIIMQPQFIVNSEWVTCCYSTNLQFLIPAISDLKFDCKKNCL